MNPNPSSPVYPICVFGVILYFLLYFLSYVCLSISFLSIFQYWKARIVLLAAAVEKLASGTNFKGVLCYSTHLLGWAQKWCICLPSTFEKCKWKFAKWKLVWYMEAILGVETYIKPLYVHKSYLLCNSSYISSSIVISRETNCRFCIGDLTQVHYSMIHLSDQELWANMCSPWV